MLRDVVAVVGSRGARTRRHRVSVRVGAGRLMPSMDGVVVFLAAVGIMAAVCRYLWEVHGGEE